MASLIALYDDFWKLAMTGGLDLDGSEIRVRLVTSGYTPVIAETPSGSGRYYISASPWDTGDDDAFDPSAHEVASGAGYTTGGIQLSGAVVTDDVVSFSNLTWPALTKTFRAAVGVAIGTFGGVTDPVLFYLLPDSTPADIVSNGSDYSILWDPSLGLFYWPK